MYSKSTLHRQTCKVVARDHVDWTIFRLVVHMLTWVRYSSRAIGYPDGPSDGSHSGLMPSIADAEGARLYEFFEEAGDEWLACDAKTLQ